MQLTQQQSDFIASALKQPTALRAVAGSGKTTTMVEAVKAILVAKPNADITCVAFNKTIATALATRMPSKVISKTMHSHGYGAWARMCKSKLKMADDKSREIWEELVPDKKDPALKLFSPVRRLASLLKGGGIVPPSASTRYACTPVIPCPDMHTFRMLCEQSIVEYDIEFDEDQLTSVIALTNAFLELSINMAHNGVIDFDDMIYMPVVFNATFSKFDYVFIDEAQDINEVQRRMLHMLLRHRAILCAVGDPNQAIYGFRGADYSSFDKIVAEFKCNLLPLSFSFRCPQLVVKEAQREVDFIQSVPSAPMGIVETLSRYDETTFTPNDVILCRNVRPLISMAINLIRYGVGCFVLGNDIGRDMLAFVDKMKARTIGELHHKARDWGHREAAKALARGHEGKVARIWDKVDCIEAVIDGLDVEPTTSVNLVKDRITTLFSDSAGGRLTLSSIHKFKGDERRRVFFLDRHLIPSKYATTPEQLQQERNLSYVAKTRAMEALYYIHSEDFRKQDEDRAAGEGSKMEQRYGE